ncbi:pirin family protein [Rhizobium halophytocola]|uniref:Redox-sensitive bicupin YhaK (Pirin superfamily) n=1 Tax=Rhizobium halophytocola TaxID=735519 RepID=A0ABS4DUY1_9HYPH|nr:pirin-like bicupin family protein [Rhizobium halophytocola]MBP1849490.1 redox-sensitive bicupin YhaK (pirin superfamily) [Rhizobium halophytocola]
MNMIHESMNRGHTNQGWLDSRHTFSFGGFHDPTRMGFGLLRVINEDWIVPGAGFAEHAHDNMDILTLVLSGRLEHRDTLGNVSVITPGDIQLMSAGSGLRHSEMNASDAETAHVLQIWLIPNTRGGAPHYQQARLPTTDGARDWTPIAGGGADAAPLGLLSDTTVSIAYPREGDRLQVPQTPGRRIFVHLIEGLARIGAETLRGGDALEITDPDVPELEWMTDGAALLFDMQP